MPAFDDSGSYIGGSFQAKIALSPVWPLSGSTEYTNMKCVLEAYDRTSGTTDIDDTSWCDEMDDSQLNRRNWEVEFRLRYTPSSKALLKEIDNMINGVGTPGSAKSQGPFVHIQIWEHTSETPVVGSIRNIVGRITTVKENIPNEKAMWSFNVKNKDLAIYWS